MRLNTGLHSIERAVTIYLNGKKEDDAIEVYIPGNVLEGRGYVVRALEKALDVEMPLPPGRYHYANEWLCEKAFGQVRIEVHDSPSLFEDS
jgi:hypothetical protein